MNNVLINFYTNCANIFFFYYSLFSFFVNKLQCFSLILAELVTIWAFWLPEAFELKIFGASKSKIFLELFQGSKSLEFPRKTFWFHELRHPSLSFSSKLLSSFHQLLTLARVFSFLFFYFFCPIHLPKFFSLFLNEIQMSFYHLFFCNFVSLPLHLPVSSSSVHVYFSGLFSIFFFTIIFYNISCHKFSFFLGYFHSICFNNIF